MRFDIVLKDGQLVGCTEVRNAIFGARQVHQDDLCPAQFCGVIIDDVLKLRSLRMTVWSGGLREVDHQDRTEEFVA